MTTTFNFEAKKVYEKGTDSVQCPFRENFMFNLLFIGELFIGKIRFVYALNWEIISYDRPKLRYGQL